VSVTTLDVPESPRRLRLRYALSIAQDVALICMVSVFAYAHASRVIVDGIYTAAPFAVENAIYAILFLTRRRSFTTSARWQDWLAAAVGGWLPLTFQVQDGVSPAMAITGTAIQMVGLIVACICLLGLGRSFGIVAANRGLKTGGVYAIVRHPIYAAHTVTSIGFLVANPHAINVILFSIAIAGQIYRMSAEERLLESTTDYRTYKQRVRYRIIPGIY
jgi:protein-S-isoprenylcysteine O-methyltransferase Ste14